MTPQELHALKVAAFNLIEGVRRSKAAPLLQRATGAADLAEGAAALLLRLVGAVEFLNMRLSALESEKSGGASTNEVQDGERG